MFSAGCTDFILAEKERGYTRAGKQRREADIIQHVIFLFFSRALAPSKCLSYASKACLKLI